jgi:hypothetical protein
MDADYIACSVVTQDAVWLKSFMHHLKIVKLASNPITFYRDNTAAVAVVKDPKYHEKTKHIKVRYHYIRDAITKHDVILKHISINSMIADPLIKPIVMDAFVRHEIHQPT